MEGTLIDSVGGDDVGVFAALQQPCCAALSGVSDATGVHTNAWPAIRDAAKEIPWLP